MELLETVQQGPEQRLSHFRVVLAVGWALLLDGVAPRMTDNGPACGRSASHTSLSPKAWVSWLRAG